jgi:hypothetical protein
MGSWRKVEKTLELAHKALSLDVFWESAMAVTET